MKHRHSYMLIGACMATCLLSACNDPKPKTEADSALEQATIVAAMQDPIEVEIHSLDDLMTLFKEHHYDSENWQNGNREIPRLSFAKIGERWAKSSQNLPVPVKKEVFFRLMAPLVLIANEKILLERQIINNEAITSESLIALARKYKVIDESVLSLTQQQKIELLERVDIMPPSLALAQSAEESGWGTSRFTREGNSFFGQWDFSGKGMVPKQQRKELGNYGLARFDSPLASVEGYMLNINTQRAYQKLRTLRAQLRADGKPISGLELAGTLDKYSERGQAYIDSIREMIRYNKLQEVDKAYLSDDKLIHLKAPE
ncbi:glucosaminidase [Thalassotalea sp. HSM 43]|uniref:glucosaminidase domain-containing protein n=1 Tax=Thalassotalea sp. HSM 43 TaxID=2552945 RepID=UPI00108062DA|nr:glucosaminidase domain-containing protein [Thalassotalea sp. HSM 43]QBY05470.1 glucosaminidase [Thalassotalea sp. HSM 43]